MELVIAHCQDARSSIESVLCTLIIKKQEASSASRADILRQISNAIGDLEMAKMALNTSD